MELPGAVVVVTGASSGIGRASAIAFARAGATVVASARRLDRLEALAEEISSHWGRALAVPCDASSLEEVRELRRRTIEAFGRCDVLVNNAGVPGGGTFEDLSIEQIERIVRVNYLGVLYGTKTFLPDMVAAGRGHIVNMASLAGRFAVPGSAVYSSTKHAVVAFSESLHYELAPRGVLVTAVNPGLVETETFPHRDAREGGRRVMAPEVVADVVLDVVRRGIGPERSVPRWIGSLQAFRLLTPPLYRAAMRQIVKRGMRATRAGEADERGD
jgi:short-subunit dehydrogenase